MFHMMSCCHYYIRKKEDKVSKLIATGFMGLFLCMLLFLSGCQFSLISPESAFEETQVAMQGIDNVEIKYREEFADEIFRGRYLLDINRDEKWIELSEDKDRKSTRLNSSHVAISYAVF